MAYETLSDPQKKQIYDQLGEDGLKSGMGMNGGGNPNDIFNDIFSGMGMNMGGGAGSRRSKVKKKAKSILHQVEVTLEDMYKGTKKTLEITRNRICAPCSGKGTNQKNVDTTCKACNGKGFRIVTRQIPMGMVQQQETCKECNGEGEYIKEKDKCTSCRGHKITSKKAKLELNVDKGIYDGKKLIFEKEGSEVLGGGEPGDIYIEVKQKSHNMFTRKGADLIYKMNITLLEALTGFKKYIDFLDGSEVLIMNGSRSIIQPGIKIFDK